MSPHPKAERLGRGLARCLPRVIPWSGSLYRSASPRYANKDDLLTGVGSKTAGARWNPPNSFRTVYTSLDPETALAEVLAHFRHYGFPVSKAMPRVIVSLEAKLQRVLDLTDGAVRRVLGVSNAGCSRSRGGMSRGSAVRHSRKRSAVSRTRQTWRE
jgi:RES domain-containing protein